jgi:hypothetical protein
MHTVRATLSNSFGAQALEAFPSCVRALRNSMAKVPDESCHEFVCLHIGKRNNDADSHDKDLVSLVNGKCQPLTLG